MRKVIAAGLGLALAVVGSTAAFAECAGHVTQQSVQAPAPSTATTTATTPAPSQPRG